MEHKKRHKLVNILFGWLGRLVLMREENRKYYEKKDKEIIGKAFTL